MDLLIKFVLGLAIFMVLITMALYFLQTRLIFFPEKLPDNYTYSFDTPFEELNYHTSPGVSINALHFKLDDPKGIILYFHGNAGSLRGWGDIAQDFIQYGHEVLVIDYRSYGKSTGQISEQGLHHDARYIYNKLSEKYPEDRIVIYGRSIGTGIATRLAARNSPGQLILEAPFYNFPDLAKRYFPWVPRWMIRYKFRNDKYIERVECPVYIVHGTADEVINVAEGKKLAKKLKPEDELILIQGGHHNDLNFMTEYHEQLDRILK